MRRYIASGKSQVLIQTVLHAMLAQHYADTAYTLPAHNAELAYRTLGGEHTIIANPKPSRATAISLVRYSKRDVSLHQKSLSISLTRHDQADTDPQSAVPYNPLMAECAG